MNSFHPPIASPPIGKLIPKTLSIPDLDKSRSNLLSLPSGEKEGEKGTEGIEEPSRREVRRVDAVAYGRRGRVGNRGEVALARRR